MCTLNEDSQNMLSRLRTPDVFENRAQVVADGDDDMYYLSWIYALLGNGDEHKGSQVLIDIALRLMHARAVHKWPDEAFGKYQALGVIGDEYRELEQAVEKESPDRQRDEALDVIATAIRFYNGEHVVDEDAA